MNNHRSAAAKKLYVDNSSIGSNQEKRILKRHAKTREQAVKESRESGMNLNEYLNFLDEF